METYQVSKELKKAMIEASLQTSSQLTELQKVKREVRQSEGYANFHIQRVNVFDLVRPNET